jgi:serine protease Do
MPAAAPPNRRATWARWSCWLLVCYAWPSLVPADIYRYQDDQGNWYFTDSPPEGYASDRVLDITETTKVPARNLAAELLAKFKPATPIAQATLAVVTVKTSIGEGSGFFCAEDGHILTNRHLVRPSESGQFQDTDAVVTKREQEVAALEANLDQGRNQLRQMEQDLASYAELTEKARDGITRDWVREASARLSERYQQGKESVSELSRKVHSMRHDVRASRRELDRKRTADALQTTFAVILKDGTELSAFLEETSPDQDLALLKVDGYRTPFLALDRTVAVSQGIQVFAIGSPLGMQDSATAGVITQITPERIVTDAQVLPGNSGGPLITEDGDLIGINVSEIVAAGDSVSAAGFGTAIPIEVVRRQFPAIMANRQAE